MDMYTDGVLLDVTCVITLISDTSHKPHDLLSKFSAYVKLNRTDRYSEKVKSIHEEMEDEIANPLHPKLINLLKDKRLYIVEEAYDRICTDMQMIMNVNE